AVEDWLGEAGGLGVGTKLTQLIVALGATIRVAPLITVTGITLALALSSSTSVSVSGTIVAAPSVGAVYVIRTQKPSPRAPRTVIDGSLELRTVSLPVELLRCVEETSSTAAPPGEPMPVPWSMKPRGAVR